MLAKDCRTDSGRYLDFSREEEGAKNHSIRSLSCRDSDINLVSQAWPWWALGCSSLKPQQKHNSSREPSQDRQPVPGCPAGQGTFVPASALDPAPPSLALGGQGMAVVGSSDPEEAASSYCVACAGTGVTWRSPGSQDESGNKLWMLEPGGGGPGFVAFLGQKC